MNALERAKQALAHNDQFNGDKFNNEALFMCPSETLFELPHSEGQFTLADLRALVEYAERSPRVGDGTGDAALAIAEEAFRAGCAAYDGKSHWASVDDLWDAFEPSDAMKDLS